MIVTERGSRAQVTIVRRDESPTSYDRESKVTDVGDWNMDPITAAAAAGGVYLVSKETVGRILGPTLDLYGEELRALNERYLERRQRNVGRIFAKAQQKLGDRINEEGSVHPKVLKEILDDGSYTEDELAADYFGGVLASSRSGIDRDDRGAAFAKMVSRLSTYQLRLHFLCYRFFKEIFDATPFQVANPDDRTDMRIYIPLEVYRRAMDHTKQEDVSSILSHAVFGLVRESLIEQHTRFGSRDYLMEEWKHAPGGGILLSASALGIELFHWAHSLGHIPVHRFLDPRVMFESDIEISSIEGVFSTTQFFHIEHDGRPKGAHCTFPSTWNDSNI